MSEPRAGTPTPNDVPDRSGTLKFTCIGDARKFVLGGHAVLTVVSSRTRDRLTFQVVRATPREGQATPPYFVSVLTGPNNTADYTYLGLLTVGGDGRLWYRHGSRSIAVDSKSAKVASWFVRQLNRDLKEPTPLCDVWHLGYCGRCGRQLTTPKSIATGFGPHCAEKV